MAKKGVYVDGHDRPDVVDYRNKVFLPQMAEVERRSYHYLTVEREINGKTVVCSEHVDTFQWGDKDTELKREQLGRFGGHLHSQFLPCERPVILVVQDETIVRQFDCHKTFWGTEDMRMLLRKTDGRGLMFSGFLTEEVGIPVPTEQELVRNKHQALGRRKVSS